MRLRLGGLALACAFGALAIWGIGTASATRLCSTNTAATCPVANRWGATHPITGEVSTPFQIATAGGNMNCNKAKISGELLNAGGGAGVNVSAEVRFAFAECSIGGTNCTVMADRGPYQVGFAWTGPMGFNGTMEISPEWEFVCGLKLNCLFTKPGAKLNVTGAEAAEIGASEMVLSRQGTICTTSAKLNANFILSSPGPMYVTNE